MYKPGYQTRMLLNGVREPVELLSVQKLDVVSECGEPAYGLTFRALVQGFTFSMKRHKFSDCECNFCCDEVVGAEGRRGVIQG